MQDNSSSPTEMNMKWWTITKPELQGQTICSIVDLIRKRQAYQRLTNMQNIKLYGNLEAFYPTTQASFINANKDSLRFNVVQSCVDTLESKITKNKPRVTFLTENGKWEQQQNAKKLQTFIDGQFYKTKLYDSSRKVFQHSAILGDGFLKVFNDKKEIQTEVVIKEEIVVDDMDGFYGSPKSLFQVRAVRRDLLLDLYPKHATAINTAKPIKLDNTIYADTADMIYVVEAWRLPTADVDPKDQKTWGHHAIAINTKTLMIEPYKRKKFPFIKLPYNPMPYGYFARGIPDIIKGLQVSINRHLIKLEKSLDLFESPRVWVQIGSKVNTKAMSNMIGQIGHYRGSPPVIDSQRVVSPEVYQHIENLYLKAFEQVGISRMSATSMKPAGLNSGVAQRTYQDIETERYATTAQRYDAFHLEVADHFIDNAQELKEMGVSITSRGLTGDAFDYVDWKDIKLDEDDYMIKMYPTSSLPQEPSGRLEYVTEMMNTGMIDAVTGAKMYDFPDVKAHTSILYAGQEAVEKVAGFLAKGKYIGPEPFMNLEYGLSYMQNMYLKLKTDGAPDKILRLFRNWVADAKGLQDKVVADMQAKQQAMAMTQPTVPPPTGPTPGAAVPQQDPAVLAGVEGTIPPIV